MKKEARCFWKQHPQLSLPPHSGPDQILRGQTVLGTSPGTARSSLPLLGAVAAAGWHSDRLCCHRAGTLSAFLHCGATTSQAFLATPRLLSAARLPEPAEGQMWGLIKLKKKKKDIVRFPHCYGSRKPRCAGLLGCFAFPHFPLSRTPCRRAWWWSRASGNHRDTRPSYRHLWGNVSTGQPLAQ